MLNYDAFKASTPVADPFPHAVTPNFMSPEAVAEAIRDYPKIDMGGLFLPEAAPYGPAFAQLLKELEGPEVRQIMEEKLGIDLTGCPTMVTVRSNCQAKDGRIHADAKFKIATFLLYLNEDWVDQGGKLRVLRSGTNIENYAAEVAPTGGLSPNRRQPEQLTGRRLDFRTRPGAISGCRNFRIPRGGPRLGQILSFGRAPRALRAGQRLRSLRRPAQIQ
jgi:SM-20-related protein